MASPAQAAQLSSSRSGSRLGRNIAVLAGSQMATWSLSLLWTIFVPRALGPHGLGVLTIAIAVTGVVAVIAGLGIGTLMVKEIARDHSKAPGLVGTALLIRAGFAVPAVVVVGAYALVGRWSGEQELVLWVATAAMVLGLLTQPFQSAFQGLERMEYLAYGDILTKAVMSLAGIVLVIIGFRAIGIMVMMLGIAAVDLLLNIWWSRGRFGIDWKLDRDRIRFLLVGSLPYWTTGLVLTFYMWIDSVMLSVMSPDVVVGWYAVPTKIFTTLLFVPVILSTAMLPRLSAAFRDGLDSLRTAGKPALELVLVLSLPVAVGAAMVAQQFLAAVYSDQYAASTWVLIILALTLPPTYFNIMANQVLIASNRQVIWTKVMIGAAILNPVINLFLIRYFQVEQHNGAIGAALSLLITEIGMASVGLFVLPPMLDFGSALRLVRAAGATAGMALVVWALSGYGLIVEGVAGMIAFAFLAVMFKVLTAEEARLLRKTVSRLARGANGRAGYSTSQYRGWDDVSVNSIQNFRR
jgi:O-antigen/teichoic acid export membrane protein